MAKAQDPPSPVDAYEAPPPPTPAGGPTPPPYSPAPEYALGQSPYAPSPYVVAPRRDTNVLAIVALICACAGILVPLADVAGVIMGFIALSQIKRTGEEGHGMALAAVIVGFAVFFLELLAVVAYIIFIVWIIGVAGSSANYGDYSTG